MTYQKMSDKNKKIVDKERMPGGKKMARKDMHMTDSLEVGKKDAIVERTRQRTKQTEDMKYKVKVRKDKKQ